MEILGKVVPESQTSVKIGHDTGVNPLMIQSVLGAPKKGNDQKRCLIDIGERLLPTVGKNRVRKLEKCQNLGNDAGLKPIDDLMCPST